jgi:hypothetical protein
MKKLIGFGRVLAIFVLSGFAVAPSVRAQSEAIIYQTLAPSVTGLGTSGSYGSTGTITNAQVDSVWTVLLNTNMIANLDIYTAQKVSGADTGSVQKGLFKTLAFLPSRPLSVLQPYQVSRFAEFRFATVALNVAATDTGIIGIPSGGTFVVTNVVVVGSNDTSGYTSNATIKIGTSIGSGNIVASLVPPLGAANCLSGTLVSPRVAVPSGTPIYQSITTAAVSTTEHARIAVIGYYE